jgi:hypothetical protein
MYSRTGFPDLQFILHDIIPTEQRVAVRWSAEGTHLGDLASLPASGKRLRFAGQTIYDLAGNQVAGHWQVVDRLGFIQQNRGEPSGITAAWSAMKKESLPWVARVISRTFRSST